MTPSSKRRRTSKSQNTLIVKDDDSKIIGSYLPHDYFSSHGSFSLLPDEIFCSVALFLGPYRDLLMLEATHKTYLWSSLHTCWEHFSREDFKGFRLSSDTRLDAAGKSYKLRFFETKKALSLFRGCGVSKAYREIFETRFDDEIIFFNMLFVDSTQPVYVEINVSENSDSFSFSLVDFDGSGQSSVTFSPDTGVVIKEKKVAETPGKVEGAYATPLRPISHDTVNERFTGKVGLYVRRSKLAFLRRSNLSMLWETTNFVADTNWLSAGLFTPCVSFRDKGAYRVTISEVSRNCPIESLNNSAAIRDEPASWHALDW
jgi:hypothetical protein